MQLVITVSLAAAFLLASVPHAASALAGGAIGIAANVPMAIAVLGFEGAPKRALHRMYLGQLTKVVFTVAMLLIVARTEWVRWLPLLVAYAAMLAVFWWVPFSAARRAVKASRG
jgi:F0F1-type ATP synthase assembly protein I